VSGFFGDSYRAVSEIDVLTLMLGMAAGLLLGMIPVPLPGGLVVRLGLAGGPLIVALTLGALERTGPLVWNIPFSANLTLRQLGLILFLAGIGTRSGWVFVSTLAAGGGGGIFVAGTLLTCGIASITLWTGHRILGIPMSVLIGMLAGLQTQPAVLGFALAQTRNELPNVGYAAVYPVAIVGKILLAQLLLLTLQ
jgi:putative transport protein